MRRGRSGLLPVPSSLSLFAALLGLAIGPPVAIAHGLRHEIARGEAVIVLLYHEEGDPFANEAYEVYAPGGLPPHQVGRTDAAGRLSFLPDRAGAWRIKVFSEDGHGLDIAIDAAPGQVALGGPSRPLIERFARPIAGAGLILGAFGVLALFTRGRRT